MMNYSCPKNSRSRTRFFTSRKTWVSIIAFALLALLTTTAFMAGPGAIFTTDGTCSGTNINIFANKDAVYLDGGPVHDGAAGLANGTYCVQVTTPDGVQLGMSAEGAVTVTDGEFDECYQTRIVDAIDGVEVNLINLENLKRNKTASGRTKDRADVEKLDQIRRKS